MNPSAKDEIMRLVFEDAKHSKTGLIQVLKDEDNKEWLIQNFIKIYDVLYTNGKVDEEQVKKLLCADRKAMQEYIKLFGKFSDEKDEKKSKLLLERIFRYENFSNRKAAYKILKQMDVRVCPYCNRQYTVTLKSGEVRPQFDHYYPKSLYPYLALSVFNLVPCCSICNMAKTKLDTDTDPILYPFSEEFGYDVFFTTERWKNTSLPQYIRGLTDKFDIKISNPKGVLKEEVNKQIDKLHIEKLYKEHKDYVQDILKHNYVYTDKRLNELCKTFPDLFHSVDEAKSFIYLTGMEKGDWGKRPLGKLTSDIVRQLEYKDFLG